MIAMLIASHDTQNALRSYAIRAGFDIDDGFPFHVTLLATANPISAPETDHQIAPVAVEPDGFEALGADGDVPVLRVTSEGALDLAREFFVEVYGAEPTFADFKPHISLSYDWQDGPELEELDAPDFPLIFDRLVVTEFKPEQKSLIFPRPRSVFGAHWVYR